MLLMPDEQRADEASRWAAYVEQRLGELERGEGDYTGLRRPSAAAVTHARAVAAGLFRSTTPTPSVVPDEEGAVAFVWHKNRMDVEILVDEMAASIWVHDRDSGQEWCSPVTEHRSCCLPRVLDRLEGEAGADLAGTVEAGRDEGRKLGLGARDEDALARTDRHEPLILQHLDSPPDGP